MHHNQQIMFCQYPINTVNKPNVNGKCKKFLQLYEITAVAAGFPLYFDIEIQGLSRTLKMHFQRPILDGSLRHGQYYSNI